MEGGEVTEELIYCATISKEVGEDYDDSDRSCLNSHTLQECFLHIELSLDVVVIYNVDKNDNDAVQVDLLAKDCRLSLSSMILQFPK